MSSRDVIQHPGPETAMRMVSAIGDVSRHTVEFHAGENLLSAVARLMESAGCSSGLLILDDIAIGPFDYVMPSYANDDLHAAWYSETHSCITARVRNATAIVGRRDGEWWLHCHALWDTGNVIGMGHLLPDTVVLTSDATITLYAFSGGTFNVELDPETAFPIFHVEGEQRTHGSALIAKINPHEDIYAAIQKMINDAGFKEASIFGIGSLIGARFEEGEPMECPISEVLITPGASWDGALHLPMQCVDTEKTIFAGNIIKGSAPVLVTFEVMIVATADEIR